MDCIAILAQTSAGSGAEAVTIPVQRIWEQIVSLNLVEALTFISFGTVCLLYGWRVFKILVTICFALLGLLLGVWANKLIGGNVMWLSIICMVILAVLSVPLMRWGVSVLGAAAGGVLTGGGWLALNLPQQYIWAGALVGVVAGGMISFIVFKVAVILFTSLGGSGLMVVGIMAVLYQYMGAAEKLEEFVFDVKWFLPAALLAPMVVGVILQHKFIKGAQDWTV
ncbi:MAG: hypothetical protein JSU70_17285 [Phycisphaerales bacterium]|nr:MAG: hypothetical protein JSU70_17285 [Phycisphaerales bacterium]